jgi:hypothetical protein
LKRTRIEVISVKRRVVSRSGSDTQDGDTDIEDVLLSALGEIVSPADELRHEINEAGAEFLDAPFQPLRLRLSRMRECCSHIFKKRSNKP